MAIKRKTRRSRSVAPQNSGMNPLLVALGAGAGAAGGAAMGRRAANKTKARIPGVATKMANKSINDYNNARVSAANAAQQERVANDRAYSGATGRDESRFQRRLGASWGEDKLAARKRMEEIESSRKMEPSQNKQTINQRLRRAPKVAAARTKKYAGRAGAAGGALAVLAQLVAAEMSKKK